QRADFERGQVVGGRHGLQDAVPGRSAQSRRDPSASFDQFRYASVRPRERDLRRWFAVGAGKTIGEVAYSGGVRPAEGERGRVWIAEPDDRRAAASDKA